MLDLLRSSALVRLWIAKRASSLGNLLSARSEVWQLLRSPFIHAEWKPRERLERLIDHCAIVDTLGLPFNVPLNTYAELFVLGELGPGYRLKLDNPSWILRDGLLTLSLWCELDRLFSIHFLFGYRHGDPVAFIGGIQGRNGENARDQIRAFAKTAAGLHPSYVLVELFRSLCGIVGIKRIFAVSNETRHQRAAYFTRRMGYTDPVTLDYDALWRERSGRPAADGMFELPIAPPERAESSVPRSKRSRYRARRQLLATLRDRLGDALAHPQTIEIAPHEPGGHPPPGFDVAL